MPTNFPIVRTKDGFAVMIDGSQTPIQIKFMRISERENLEKLFDQIESLVITQQEKYHGVVDTLSDKKRIEDWATELGPEKFIDLIRKIREQHKLDLLSAKLLADWTFELKGWDKSVRRSIQRIRESREANKYYDSSAPKRNTDNSD